MSEARSKRSLVIGRAIGRATGRVRGGAQRLERDFDLIIRHFSPFWSSILTCAEALLILQVHEINNIVVIVLCHRSNAYTTTAEGLTEDREVGWRWYKKLHELIQLAGWRNLRCWG